MRVTAIVSFCLPRFVDRLRATGREATGSLHCEGQQLPHCGWKQGGRSRKMEELPLHPNMRLNCERDGIWAVGSINPSRCISAEGHPTSPDSGHVHYRRRLSGCQACANYTPSHCRNSPSPLRNFLKLKLK